jgi:hypothetical protein
MSPRAACRQETSSPLVKKVEAEVVRFARAGRLIDSNLTQELSNCRMLSDFKIGLVSSGLLLSVEMRSPLRKGWAFPVKRSRAV